MFVFANLVEAIATILSMALRLYFWILVARVVISWVNADPYNPIVRAIVQVTEPVLYRIRRTLPVYFGGIDFSPIVVILALEFLQIFLVRSLHQLAGQMMLGLTPP
jgi:YggT family protein